MHNGMGNGALEFGIMLRAVEEIGEGLTHRCHDGGIALHRERHGWQSSRLRQGHNGFRFEAGFGERMTVLIQKRRRPGRTFGKRVIRIHDDEEVAPPPQRVGESSVTAGARSDFRDNESVQLAHGHGRVRTTVQDLCGGTLDFAFHRVFLTIGPIGRVRCGRCTRECAARHRNLAAVSVDSDPAFGAMR